MAVAMAAQDLVRFKIGTAIHTHTIPSVHGSGAIGLKTVQSNTVTRHASRVLFLGLRELGKQTLDR